MERLMSQKYPASAAAYEPAMTFEEIGRELGIPKQAVYFLFVSALKKLRRHGSGAKQLLEIAECRESERRSKALRVIGTNSEVA